MRGRAQAGRGEGNRSPPALRRTGNGLSWPDHRGRRSDFRRGPAALGCRSTTPARDRALGHARDHDFCSLHLGRRCGAPTPEGAQHTCGSQFWSDFRGLARRAVARGPGVEPTPGHVEAAGVSDQRVSHPRNVHGFLVAEGIAQRDSTTRLVALTVNNKQPKAISEDMGPDLVGVRPHLRRKPDVRARLYCRDAARRDHEPGPRPLRRPEDR
jgi:hypothetical protein